MKSIRTSFILKLAALPIALAAVALLLSGGFSAANHARANQPNANLEYTLHVGSASTAADAKGNATVSIGSTFTVSASLDARPGAYDAIAFTLNYSGVLAGRFENANKGAPHISGYWPDCVFEVSPPASPGFQDVSCNVGTGSAGSTFLGTVFATQLTCLSAGTGEVHLVHGAPSDTLMIDYSGKTSTETGPDRINITCQAATATAVPPTATAAPPALGGVAAYPDVGSGGGNAGLVLGGSALAALLLGAAAWRMRRVVRVS